MYLLLVAVFTLLLMWLIHRIRNPWMRALISSLVFGSLLSAGLSVGVMVVICLITDAWPSLALCYFLTGLFVYPMWFVRTLSNFD